MHRLHPAGLVACLLLLLLAAPGSSRAEDEPPADHAAKRAAEQALVQKMVDELRPVVSKMRGLAWKRDVPAKLLSRDELRAYLEAQMAKDVTPEEMARDTRIVKRLGLIAEDEDLTEMQLLMLQEMVAGAYDPETKQLYVIEGFTGEGQKPTLVHELIHALDDQHFDLRAMEEPYREHDPDRQFAIRCLFEGSAEYARRRYQDEHLAVARTYYEQLGNNADVMAGQQRVMKAVPAHLLLASLLHYRAGPNFITHAVGDDYVGGMARIFEDPPVSQEQILHPHKWLGPHRDYPRRVNWGPGLVEAGGEGWKQLDEHTVGELDFAVFLDYFLGDERGRLNMATMGEGKFVSKMANRAARGWDAGHVRYLESPDGHIVVAAAYAFDTVADAADAAGVMGAALSRANGDAWKGTGWKSATLADHDRLYDYTGKHGRGRIFQRGREVLLLDGARDRAFDRLWASVELTSFTQDERDQGDDAPDPFAGCAVVDRWRGLGLALPNDAWSVQEDGGSRFSFANVSNGAVRVSYIVLDQEVTQAGLPRMGKMVLGPAFDEKKAAEAKVMGLDGLRHPLPGGRGELYLASDAARTYLMLVVGPAQAREEAAGDVRALLQGMRVPGRGGAPPGAGGSAGLRSVPGY